MNNINTLLDACLETSFEFPEDFCLQAGIYGGLVMAAAVAKTESEAQYPVRTLQLNFSALARPSVATTIELDCRRRGSKTETYDIAFVQGAVCVAHGSLFTGQSRGRVEDQLFLERPKAEPSDAVTALGPSMPLPPYTQHFELRPCIGQMVMSKSAPITGGYIRYRDPDVKALGVPHLAALIDAWWPSFLVSTDRMMPMGTTSIQVNFSSDATPVSNDPFLIDVRGQFVSGGFGSESNFLWSHDGRLLASAHQCIAMIA